VRVVWNGISSGEHVHRMFEFVDRHLPDGKPYYIIADQSRLTFVDASGRKVASTDPRGKRIAGVALFGASFQVRVVMAMVMKGMKLLLRKDEKTMYLAKNEADAVAWLEELRHNK